MVCLHHGVFASPHPVMHVATVVATGKMCFPKLFAILRGSLRSDTPESRIST